jgi:hypothetical protein
MEAPPAMDEIAKTILSAKRKRFLRSRPIFERHASVTEAELFHLAVGMNFKFVLGLSKWLRMAGYGDIDESLSFRESCFSILSGTPLDGCVSFAQDAAGNRYAFNPADGSIYCLFRSGPRSARISDSFQSFMQELVQRDYQLQPWMDSLTSGK